VLCRPDGKSGEREPPMTGQRLSGEGRCTRKSFAPRETVLPETHTVETAGDHSPVRVPRDPVSIGDLGDGYAARARNTAA